MTKYMQPDCTSFREVLHRVWTGKPTVKKSLTHAIKQTENYREYVQGKEDAWQKSVDEWEMKLANGELKC